MEIKIDLEEKRVISKEKREEIAKEYLFLFYETSAKTGEKVKESFKHLIHLIIVYKQEELLKAQININLEVEKDNDSKIEDIYKKPKHNDKWCCCKKKS